MKIYISLPITGYNIYDQKQLANKVKNELVALGYDAITPFEVVPEGEHPYEYYIGRDIEALLNCDAIYMCDGHENSKGCRLEHTAALIYGKFIINKLTAI